MNMGEYLLGGGGMLNISYDTFPVLILVPLLLLSCVYHRPPILNAFDTARVFEHAQEEFITKVRKLHPPLTLTITLACKTLLYYCDWQNKCLEVFPTYWLINFFIY